MQRCADIEGAALGEGAFASGPAIWVGKREVAHFDDDRTIDVRLTKNVIRTRRAELKGDERISFRPGSSDWLRVHVTSESNVDHAVALIRDAVDANLPTASPGLPPTGAELARRRRFH